MTRCLAILLVALLPSLGACGDDSDAADSIHFEVTQGSCTPECDDVQLAFVVTRDDEESVNNYCLQRVELSSAGTTSGQLSLANIEHADVERLYIGVRVFCQSEPDCLVCAGYKPLTDFTPNSYTISLQATQSCFADDPIDTSIMPSCAGF